MQCVVRCGAILAAILVGLAAVLGAAGLRASAWLAADDVPMPAAAIVVLGEEPTRALAGADLYREGIAPRVLLSVPMRSKRQLRLAAEGIAVPWFEETGALLLAKHGVPRAAIDTFGEALKSTYAEGRALADRIAPGERVVVVTSPYHVRRARMILRDALPGREVLVVGSGRYEPLPGDWWTEQEATRHVLLEAVKFAYYLGGGRFR
jgi:uncharacterized SAM-binding protein YcdF (DUF218 family)